MSTKTIVINDFPPIQDIAYELERTRKVLTDLLSKRFRSETNTNTLDYAMDALDGYCYVPLNQRLWLGRYARYLSLENPKEIKLRLGGFVVADNGYTVSLKQTDEKFVRVKKNSNHVFFMTIIEDDVTRIQMNNAINQM